MLPLVMAATDFGRPIVAPPGFPADKTKIFREAFMKAMNDPELLGRGKKEELRYRTHHWRGA